MSLILWQVAGVEAGIIDFNRDFCGIFYISACDIRHSYLIVGAERALPERNLNLVRRFGQTTVCPYEEGK